MSNPILFVNTTESNVVVTGNVNVTESTTVTGDLNVTGGGELRVINADNAVAQRKCGRMESIPSGTS